MKKILGTTLAFCFMITAAISISVELSVKINTNKETIYASTEYARGGQFIQSFSEDIYYDYKVEDKYSVKLNDSTPAGMPAYSIGSSYTCGIIAGSQVLGGYNRIYNGLVPNHNPIGSLLGQPVWSGANATIYALQDDLYIRMNSTPIGVTMSGYLNGLSSYASSKNYNLTNTSMMDGNSLDLTSLKTKLNQNKYATVFMSGFNIVSVIGQSSLGYDAVSLEEYGGAHIMSVFGYRIIHYYSYTAGLLRTSRYLEVVTGFSGSRALLLIDNYVTIDNLFVAEID